MRRRNRKSWMRNKRNKRGIINLIRDFIAIGGLETMQHLCIC